VSKRRDNLIFLSGLLLGLGIGLLLGLLLLIWGVSLLMHHMFIMGVQWSSIGFLTIFGVIPFALVIVGLLTRRKASRSEYE
jgi:ATP/ADP translocase